MSTQKRPSRRKKVSLDNDDFKEIVYTEEEAEMLGFRTEDDDNDEDKEEDEDSDCLEKETNIVAPRKEVFHKKKPTTSDRFYVKPEEFSEEIRKYYETDVISNELGMMISNISTKLSFAPNFINYSWREELVGDGTIRMFKALIGRKYDFEKGGAASSGPFSYFSRIAFNAFRNRIKYEKKMQLGHEKYQQELLLFSGSYNTIVKNNQIRIQKQNRE